MTARYTPKPASASVLTDPRGLPANLQADLRSDHAGETGAVYIYRGILAVSRDGDLRAFAREHLATERVHLAFFESWLPPRMHSRLLPLWRVSGWLLGAIAGLAGRRVAYLTIDAVETFVVEHYAAQIDTLERDGEHAALAGTLRGFMDEEDHHRLNAASRAMQPEGPGARVWRRIVGGGSAAAVMAARHL